MMMDLGLVGNIENTEMSVDSFVVKIVRAESAESDVEEAMAFPEESLSEGKLTVLRF